MRFGAGWALAAALLLAGCHGGEDQDQAPTNGCPKPVHYTLAQHRQIQAALDKLPPNSILRQVMTDYENERDDLRFCR
jgi:hypothetical protein